MEMQDLFSDLKMMIIEKMKYSSLIGYYQEIYDLINTQ